MEGSLLSRKVIQDAYLEMARISGIEFLSLVARVTDYYSMFLYRNEERRRIVRSGIGKAIDSCVSMSIPRTEQDCRKEVY